MGSRTVVSIGMTDTAPVQNGEERTGSCERSSGIRVPRWGQVFRVKSTKQTCLGMELPNLCITNAH